MHHSLFCRRWSPKWTYVRMHNVRIFAIAGIIRQQLRQAGDKTLQAPVLHPSAQLNYVAALPARENSKKQMLQPGAQVCPYLIVSSGLSVRRRLIMHKHAHDRQRGTCASRTGFVTPPCFHRVRVVHITAIPSRVRTSITSRCHRTAKKQLLRRKLNNKR